MHKRFNINIQRIYGTILLLDVSRGSHVCQLFGPLVGQSVIISETEVKLHIHAFLGADVS